MATYHFAVKVIGRSRGQSAIAAAAYRSGEPLIDRATGKTKHYRARSERIKFTGIFAPKDAPAWARDRATLWNEAELAERRKDSTLAREIEISLPHELTDEQRLWLVTDFVRETFSRRGLVADVAIHAPEPGADPRNHHVHILITERTIGADGFAAKKDRAFYAKGVLHDWRAKWATMCNRALERHGHAVRVDHRSLAAQGIDRIPTRARGHAATQRVRRGAVLRDDEAAAAKQIADRSEAPRIAVERFSGVSPSLPRSVAPTPPQSRAAPCYAALRPGG
jgi:ATP-dependent exoDNAse (exonuclease V) alpha subunit